MRKCKECNSEFEPYDYDEECWTCYGDGVEEAEMEWDYEVHLYTCGTCKGKGYVSYKEEKLCKNCKEHSMIDDEW